MCLYTYIHIYVQTYIQGMHAWSACMRVLWRRRPASASYESACRCLSPARSLALSLLLAFSLAHGSATMHVSMVVYQVAALSEIDWIIHMDGR